MTIKAFIMNKIIKKDTYKIKISQQTDIHAARQTKHIDEFKGAH